MTTLTTTHTRTPHPVQAGPSTALLWLATWALSLGIDLTMLFAVPVFGRIVAGDPDATRPALLAALTLAAVLFAGVFLRRYLTRTLRMQVPGALRTYTPAEAHEEPTQVPDTIIAVVRCAAVSLAAFAAAAMAASGDHGVAAALLGVYAGGSITVGAAHAARDILNFPHSWRRAITRAVLSYLAPGAAFLAAGLLLAPEGELTPMSLFLPMVMAAFMLEVLTMRFRGTGSILGRSVNGLAGELADTIVTRAEPAPTLNDRARARAWARSAVYLVGALAVVLFVALRLS